MKHLKEVIKKPVYFLSLIFFVIIIGISVVFFHGLKIASGKVDLYGQKISRISSSMNEIDDTINQEFIKLNRSIVLVKGFMDFGAKRETGIILIIFKWQSNFIININSSLN